MIRHMIRHGTAMSVLVGLSWDIYILLAERIDESRKQGKAICLKQTVLEILELSWWLSW